MGRLHSELLRFEAVVGDKPLKEMRFKRSFLQESELRR